MNLIVSRLVRLVATNIQTRRARRELHQFDRRMLADLGLTRGDIDAAVRGELWRPARYY